MRRLARGNVHPGVRWKTNRWPTFGWISGMNWAADDPVPMAATRWPVRSCPWSHRAEWKQWPVKVSRPGICGGTGFDKGPMPEITNWASNAPAVVWISHRWVGSSQRPPVTSWPKRT
jgi:hypothetical protein